MKKFLYTALCVFSMTSLSMAQTTILDFEAPATSTVFQYFGSALDGSVNTVIANPNATGLNTSSKVSRFVKPAVAEIWAGAFSNPNPTTPVDLVANNKVSINVHMDHIGVVMLKFEASTNGGANWEQTVTNTKINEWETLTFDATLPSLAGPNTPAAGFTYARVVVFFDFGTVGTGTEVVSYFDDIVARPAAATTVTILDFQAPATTAPFQYFGSALDGTVTEVINNPNPTGSNTSTKVTKYVKPAVAEVWAGAFSNPNPVTPVNLSNGGQVCADVHMDHIGSLSIKLEGSTSGKPNWITKVPNTKTGAWETLCFDSSLPSIEAPFEPASGIYERVVVFFDFGTAGTGTEVTSYLDNIVVKGSSTPVPRTVNFAVDMNSYAPNFDKVYVSGTFNNWAGNANELTDPNADGIYTGSITATNGTYEYKVTLDNWAAQEQFTGTEECIKRDPTGAFVNRLLLVSGDTDIPKFCFNTCYACGQAIKIDFKLGMGAVVPSPDGIWIAGGGNFDVPGGKYKMSDANGDKIYELSIVRQRGFKSFYTFTNGPCADYSCKEDLTGLPCGTPANFNDRFLPDVTKDTIVATCFGACFNNAQCVSGINELVSDDQLFQLMGNPAQSNVSTMLVFGNDAPAEKQVSVTNAVGQVVNQYNVAAYQAQISLPTENMPSGIYFVTVRSENRYFTRRLVR
jgi:Secretion system C-terminal sorting domain